MQQLESGWTMSWGLGRMPNPHWGMDTAKKRLYLAEKTLLWARLKGHCD